MEKTEKELTLEEKVQLALENSERALAYYEIQKVWAAHAYCYRAERQRYELDNFWSKEHDDIAYAHGSHAFVGRELVYKYYAHGNEIMNEGKLKIMNELYPDEIQVNDDNLAIGDMVLRFQATPYIEISKDNKTAKAIWSTPGFNTENDANGEPKPIILVGKECVEFVKESDGWKIWHFRDAGDFAITLPAEILSKSADMKNRTIEDAFPEFNRTLEPFPEGGPFSTKRPAKFSPELPKPFDTWSDDISWVKPAEQV